MRTSKESVGLFTGSVRGLTAVMRNMGIVVTAASALAGAGMVALSRRAERVNAAFREVDSISAQVSNTQEEYGSLVSELNTEFGLQANRLQVIQALYQSVSAGIDEGEASQREFLETAADLAVVGLVDLETSVDVLSTTLNTYNMETDDATRVSEALFRTVQFGKVTLEELAPVMGRIAALGSDMGVEIEELGAAMAQLTRNGFEARIAATGLRAILRSLMRPSEEMESILRDMAFAQGGLVEEMTEGHGVLDGMAEEYRNLTSRVEELSDAQQDARQTQEETSLSIQRARLAITAIEEGRVDAIEDSVAAEMAQSNSISELEDKINDYQFEVNESRIQEEAARLEKRELEEETQGLIDAFEEEIDTAGNLEGGIGQLFSENQGLVETLTELREVSDDQNIAFDELFPRTRALQGALALVGDGGDNFIDIMNDMKNESFDVREAWEDLDEQTKNNFDSFEEFKEEMQEIQDSDLENWADDMRGPQENLRNATSRLGEAAEDLGQVFNDELVGAIQGISRVFERLSNRLNGLDESTRQAIGRFGILSVSIGLIIGPMMFLLGQIGLIAIAMGKALIPALIIATSVFSIFAGALSAVVSEGSRGENIFVSMEGILSSLIGFLSRAKDAFNDIIAPEIVSFGNTLILTFAAINRGLKDLFDSSDDSEGGIRSFAESIAEMISMLNVFITENRNLIVSLIVGLVSALIDVAHFARGLLDVFISIISQDSVQAFILGVATTIVLLVRGIAFLLGIIGKWLSRNDDLVAGIVTVIAVIASIAFAVGKAAVAFSSLSAWIGGIAALGPSGIFLSLASSIGTVISSSTILLPLLKGISLIFSGLVAVFKVISGAIAVVVGAISLKIVIIGLLIAAVLGLIAAIWIARDEIIQALSSILSMWISVFNTLYDLITGEISWREAGANIVHSIASGITGALGSLRDAASKVASTIGEYLPTSPADKGYFSTNPPEDIGSGISEDVASGMDLEQDISSEFGDLDNSELDVESDMNMLGEGEERESSTRMSGMREDSTEINIEEGAIKVGPFEGVSDEELPRRVGEEVDESLNRIVQRLEAKGVIIE